MAYTTTIETIIIIVRTRRIIIYYPGDVWCPRPLSIKKNTHARDLGPAVTGT